MAARVAAVFTGDAFDGLAVSAQANGVDGSAFGVVVVELELVAMTVVLEGQEGSLGDIGLPDGVEPGAPQRADLAPERRRVTLPPGCDQRP
jgi:hypothetical protein